MTEKLEDQSEASEFFEEFETFEQVPAEYIKRRCIKETMFSSFYDEELIKKELTKCLRVFPHDQNTSGFFITIISKTKDFDNNLVIEESQDKQEEVK